MGEIRREGSQIMQRDNKPNKVTKTNYINYKAKIIFYNKTISNMGVNVPLFLGIYTRKHRGY